MIYKNACINGKMCDICVFGGKIVSLEKTNESGIDLGGQKVIPGLIDVHIHGSAGHDTMDGDAVPYMSEYLAANGITSFMPTTMTMPMEDIERVVCALDDVKGAQVLGYHLEGPYIAISRRGAQNAEHIRKPDIREIEKLPNVRMVTIAPEVEGAKEFTEKFKGVVSLGHTDADYAQTLEIIEAGANCLTHTFNAMTPFAHRAPGPIGAAIEKNIFVQIICDGVHLHKNVVQMLYRTFGKNRVVLISDSISATGMPDGFYMLGDQKIKVCGIHADLLDGTVAGSASNLMNDVKTAISFGIPEDDAIYMASRTPAMLMNENKGLLHVGFDADFVAVDKNFNVLRTVVAGETVYRR